MLLQNLRLSKPEIRLAFPSFPRWGKWNWQKGYEAVKAPGIPQFEHLYLHATILDNQLKVRIDATGFDSGSLARIQHTFNNEFSFSGPGKLTGRQNLKKLFLLAVFSAQFAATYSTDSCDLEVVADFYEPSAEEAVQLQNLWSDMVWQCRVAHALLQFIADEDGTKLKTYGQMLPKVPFVGYRASDLHALDFRQIDLKDTVLSMSFGKEALTTYELLKSHAHNTGQDLSDLTLGTILHSGTPFGAVYKRLMDEFLQLERCNCKSSFNESNLFEQHYGLNHRIDEDYFYLHTFALIYSIETGRNTVLVGNEFERNAFETGECWVPEPDGRDAFLHSYAPLYRFDYDQSLTLALKLNCFFKTWDLSLKIGTLLGNVNELQIQFLLSQLNPKLIGFQYSCWNATEEKRWCCNCPKCDWIMLLWSLLGIPTPPEWNADLSPERVKQIFEAYALELGPRNYLCNTRNQLEDIVVGQQLEQCFTPMRYNPVDGHCQNYRIPAELYSKIYRTLAGFKSFVRRSQ